MLLGRLAKPADELVETLDGTMVFADVSGFTRLSERLARKGKEGAEYLVDAINVCFSALLDDAYARGGSLLKFGGDAMLLWFAGDEHAVRACASAARCAGPCATWAGFGPARATSCCGCRSACTAGPTRCSWSAGPTASC